MEAVNIKRKSITLVLMLFALALTLSANTVFATSDTTTNISDQNTGQLDQINGQNLENSTVKSSKQEISQQNMAAGSPTTDNKAAGSTTSTQKVTTQKKFTSSQINSAASSVKSFIEKNKRLPNYVIISSVKVTMPQFLKLMTTNTVNLNSKKANSVTLQTVKNPSSGTGSFKAGNLSKSKYVSLAKTINSYINSHGKAPSTATSSLGKMSFKDLVYTYSKILNFQKSKKRLPNYVTVTKFKWKTGGEGSSSTSTSSSSTSSSLSKYLKVSANAQSTSSTIKNLAASITKGKTTTYAKAQAIFNWVRNHISYSFYYNTKKGALGALKSRTANCVDNSHLMVALARAAKIPARYQHGTCKFSSGTYGHVWAQLYVNGKWYYADGVSVRNSFGTIKNWNLKTYKLHGTYASLPF